MVIVLLSYYCRFEGQTQLYRSKPSDFRIAVEEAFLAEHGFAESHLEELRTCGKSAIFTRCPSDQKSCEEDLASYSDHCFSCQVFFIFIVFYF